MQLTLVNTFITELRDQLKHCKDNLKACQLKKKKKLATCREERGKPEASISADIELVLESTMYLVLLTMEVTVMV
jgi:hypothetical protein